MLSSEANAAALIATDKTNANNLFMTCLQSACGSGIVINICGERSIGRIGRGADMKYRVICGMFFSILVEADTEEEVGYLLLRRKRHDF
jgi:hypothetical protein